MNNLVKSIVVVFALALASSLSAQPVYKLTEHSPIAIGEIPIKYLSQMEDGSWSETENLSVTYYLDHTAKLNETEIYGLRKTFEPLSKIPQTFPSSTIYWRYYAVENTTSHDIQLFDNFLPRTKECKTFLWRNGMPNGSQEFSKHSTYNEFKGASPFAKDSAIAEIRKKKIIFNPKETLEILVRCVPPREDISKNPNSLFNSDTILPGIMLIQAEPMMIWSRWPLFTRGIMLGVLFALACSSLLTSLVDQTAKSWLLTGWLFMAIFASSWNQDFFEFFYDSENANLLIRSSGMVTNWIQQVSSLVFLFFSYHTLGGREEFYTSVFSRKLRGLIISAAVLCVAHEVFVQAPEIFFWVSKEFEFLKFYADFYKSIFGDTYENYFFHITLLTHLVCVYFLKFSVLYAAIDKLRMGSRSALFILLALIVSTFSDSYFVMIFTSFYFQEMEFVHYMNIKDEYPISSVPMVIQALIMSFAASRRNKETQISLDNMTKSRQRFIEEQNTLLENRVIERTQELQMQTEKTEKLMLNILPQSIAERLKDGDKEVSDKYQNTTILFSDLVGFTKMSSEKTPEELVFLLNDLFKRFDIRALSLGLEKIKTIGDAYMVVGGLPTVDDTHAIRVTKMALGMYEDLAEFNAQHGVRFDMRIGINSGPVVAGVIGHSKFSYDLWGNAVNTASRMESTSVPGKIQVSPSTFEQIKDHFDVQEHQLVECKGLGQIMTYFVNGQLPGGGPAFA